MHYYQHNIGDYRRDTTHLSLLEHGVYRQLLDMYYLSETNIPEETEVVYRRLCAKTEDEKKAVDSVLYEFFKLENGWSQKRCDDEISAFQGKGDRARTNGKLGGRPLKTKVVISGLSKITQEKANSLTHEPINQQTKEEKNAVFEKQDPIGFFEFWQIWPSGERKQAKGKCLEAWKKARVEAVSALVKAHVESLKTSATWTKNGGEFIPAPLVYLNKRSWEGAEISEPTSGRFV